MIKDIIIQPNFFRVVYRTLHWHIRYFGCRNPSPLACGFYLTSKCNFRCDFCNIWRINPDFQMPENKAKELISDLAKMGLIYFSFSGGEPLLVPYVFDLLAYAKESGIAYTHLVSNGYVMDKGKAKDLADAGVSEISFSLDGAEKIHDKNRGMNGAFRKVIEAVNQVKIHAPKTKIVLNTILDPAHPENAVFAVKTAAQLGLKIKIQPLNDHPSFGAENPTTKQKSSLSADERKKLLDGIKVMQRSSNVVNSKPFLENYKVFIFYPENLIFRNDNCIFGYHHIEIFANQAFPCLEGLAWKDGFDISKKSVREIITSPLYHSKLKELKRCFYCQKNYYICYYEPRLNFPIWNFIKSRLKVPKLNRLKEK